MIYAPIYDFEVILNEMGQNITIRKIVRTIDENGKTTNVSTNDILTVALVDEFKTIASDVGMVQRYEIGDVRFAIYANIDVTYFDKIVWNNNIYVIKLIRDPVKIASQYLYKEIECGREKL
jgi:hypothetical protein